MKAIAIVGLGLLAGARLAAAETALELYQKVKDQVKVGSCADALKTLDALDAENAKPGHDADRRSAAAPVAFYRGVCDATLGRKAEAKAQFTTFLTLLPNGAINSSQYSKDAVAAFEEAKRELGAKRPAEAAGTSIAIASAYAQFVSTSTPPAESSGADWASGPVRALLSPDEERQFARLKDDPSRSEFIQTFWRTRDAQPGSAFRQEFDRRVAFADASFGQDPLRGSLTERGMVFVLFGPPVSVARKSLGGRDDRVRDGGINSIDRHDEQLANLNQQAGVRSQTATTTSAVTSDQMQNQSVKGTDGWREVWHYSRELLPKAVPYGAVDFEFVTQRGQGNNVLEKNATAVRTIEVARKSLSKDKS